ncbi:hypothetical protein B0H14DRAFT_2940920 [Mycena olivaceomarginata]|nr:hypothetical protein B0H14DRAFT_2940920 [Mycena olivaceomarginata]
MKASVGKPSDWEPVSTRFYSPRPSGGHRGGPSRPLLDNNSGTLPRRNGRASVGGFYVSHLETAPESGRGGGSWRSCRTQALQETRAQFRGRILPPEHPLTQQVRRITRRIIGAAEPPALIEDPWGAPLVEGAAGISRPPTLHPDREWAVLVVDDPRLCECKSGTSRCGTRRSCCRSRRSSCPSWCCSPSSGLTFGLSSVLTDVLHSLPHSRALETEADTVGLKLMSRACYDPAAAPADMSRLEKGSQVPSFFRTHPPTADRVAHLKTLLPESYSIYNANPECVQLEEMRARGLLRRVRMNVI